MHRSCSCKEQATLRIVVLLIKARGGIAVSLVWVGIKRLPK